MPIAVACDDCGKIYNLPSAMAGKRVKCKACGQAFTIAAARPVPLMRPAVAAGANPLQRAMNLLPRFYPNGWVLLACLLVAVGIGFLGSSLPQVWVGAMYGFPALAALYLLLGMTVLIINAVQTPGHFKFPWHDAISTLVPFILGGALGLIIIRGRRSYDAPDVGPFYHEAATLVLRVIGMALLPLVIMLVSFSSNSFPPREPSAIDRRIAQGGSAPVLSQPRIHPPPPMITSPVVVPDTANWSDADKMRESERNLRHIAAMVFTRRLNLHKTPATLEEVFQSFPQILRSPFDPETADGYVYLPDNITGQKDLKVVMYDSAELQATGSTQALTNAFQILILSKEQLLARPEIPH